MPVRFNFCAVRFIFWAVRFIFGWFDSFFAVLIFCDRFSFYLCAFHIVHYGLEDFVRNGAPYLTLSRESAIFGPDKRRRFHRLSEGDSAHSMEIHCKDKSFAEKSR